VDVALAAALGGFDRLALQGARPLALLVHRDRGGDTCHVALTPGALAAAAATVSQLTD